MIERNPQREALLLVKWREGKNAREAAKETGIPEGTTFYYWKKFNKYPEKTNRIALSYKPQEKLNLSDYALQMFFFVQARQAKEIYESLVSQGKYAEAKASIEAREALERYINSKISHVNRITPIYLSEPNNYGFLVGYVLGEMLLDKKSEGFVDIEMIDQVANELMVLSPRIPAEHLKMMADILQFFRNMLIRNANLK